MTLREYLDLPNVTLRAFAERTALSPSALSMFANGKRSPTLKTALRIVNATHGVVSFDDLADAIDHEATA